MPRRLTEAEREGIAQMYRDGETLGEITHRYDVATTTVYAVLSRKGVPLRQRKVHDSKACEGEAQVEAMRLKIARLEAANQELRERIEFLEGREPGCGHSA